MTSADGSASQSMSAVSPTASSSMQVRLTWHASPGSFGPATRSTSQRRCRTLTKAPGSSGGGWECGPSIASSFDRDGGCSWTVNRSDRLRVAQDRHTAKSHSPASAVQPPPTPRRGARPQDSPNGPLASHRPPNPGIARRRHHLTFFAHHKGRYAAHYQRLVCRLSGGL